MADRFTLEGALVLEGVGYFDRLTLRALLDPKQVAGTVFMAANAGAADPSRA
jgi:hypothetical protein